MSLQELNGRELNRLLLSGLVSAESQNVIPGSCEQIYKCHVGACKRFQERRQSESLMCKNSDMVEFEPGVFSKKVTGIFVQVISYQ